MRTEVLASKSEVPTFKEWAIHIAKAHRNPRGDFIKDVRLDDTFPEQVNSQFELTLYIVGVTCGCGADAMELAPGIFRQYRRWVRSQAREARSAANGPTQPNLARGEAPKISNAH